MNILLIGSSGSFLELMVDKLHKEGHRIFLLTQEKKKIHGSVKIFETYRFSYGDASIKDVFLSVKPDAVLFFGAYDTSFLWSSIQNTAVQYSSGLMNMLMAFAAVSGGKFVYLSSEEVFQKEYKEEIHEEEPCAAYTAKGQAVAAGEMLCRNYRNMGQNVIILRLEHMYGTPKTAREADTVCARMCRMALETGEIAVGEAEKDVVRLLHVSDAVQFVYQILKAEECKYDLYQISSGETVSKKEIAQRIAEELHGNIDVVEAPMQEGQEALLSGKRFAEEFGVRILHHPDKEVPRMAGYMERHAQDFMRVDREERQSAGQWWQELKKMLLSLIPLLENLAIFSMVYLLNNSSFGNQYFQRIDFYLLYVLLFAMIYGQHQATIASLFSMVGYFWSQRAYRSEFDVLIDYNTYIWIAQLLILGLLVGYMRDRIDVMQEEEKHEVSYLNKKIDDIADINISNIRVKEILSDQIVNQNDSFGKIYEITSGLDKYEPGEVLFFAAEVLAKLMGSSDVAIYTVANRSYARLFSATSKKARSLGNSINYVEMGDMYRQISEKKVYINKNMEERYPLMANAIYAGDEMQLILMVWGIPWERMTLGQANMLTVIGYLIQNAVLRANRYMSALEHERYIQGTKILESEAFRSLVKAYLNARSKNLTECVFVLVDTEHVAREKAGEVLGKMMRQSDFLGVLDGKLYALLANTNAKDGQMVVKRFKEAGFDCQIQEDIAA